MFSLKIVSLFLKTLLVSVGTNDLKHNSEVFVIDKLETLIELTKSKHKDGFVHLCSVLPYKNTNQEK